MVERILDNLSVLPLCAHIVSGRKPIEVDGEVPGICIHFRI